MFTNIRSLITVLGYGTTGFLIGAGVAVVVMLLVEWGGQPLTIGPVTMITLTSVAVFTVVALQLGYGILKYDQMSNELRSRWY